MRILVTGASGMLGQALLPVLQQSHYVVGVGVEDFDVCNGKAVRDCISAHGPELVVHLAAYTDVDGCETDPRRAEETNGSSTRNVAQACAEIDAAMLYVSTDYVFDGSKVEPYCESDQPNPLNAYGRSKLLGEQYVQTILDRYFVVRTSWLFGPHGKNFVATILRLAQQSSELRVVDDQRGSPTYTRHLAPKLAQLAETNAYGIYHITGSGSCSWCEFARSIVELGGFTSVRMVPISSDECGRPARRPANSVLENSRLSQSNLVLLPHWEFGLRDYLNELQHDRDLNLVSFLAEQPAKASNPRAASDQASLSGPT